MIAQNEILTKMTQNDVIIQGNKCDLVWEGETAEAFFDTMIFKVCSTEALAREFFRDRKCEHYWDLAHSKATITKVD